MFNIILSNLSLIIEYDRSLHLLYLIYSFLLVFSLVYTLIYIYTSALAAKVKEEPTTLTIGDLAEDITGLEMNTPKKARCVIYLLLLVHQFQLVLDDQMTLKVMEL